MKKSLLIMAVAALAGCTTAQQQQVAVVATDINTQVAKACAVFQPVATDAEALYQLNPDIDLALNGLNGLCAANATIDTASVQTLAQTTIPAAVKAIGTTAGISPQLAQEIAGALTLANVALNLVVQNYTSPTPDSAPAAASAAQ
jgi:hypothetical protein